MRQPLDDDLLDDLAEPEGPASSRHALDEPHPLDDLADPHGADLLDDSGDGVEFDAAEVMEELEDAVAEALDADDADEVFRQAVPGDKKRRQEGCGDRQPSGALAADPGSGPDRESRRCRQPSGSG
jgi:hypothetical protein